MTIFSAHRTRPHRRERTRFLVEETSGQALTEFAIVVPIVVMVFMFSIWFLELVQIKLKVQEAARYVAWEAQSYPLHDYDKGKSALSSLASQMSQKVTKEAKQRYEDLDSASTMSKGHRIFSAAFTPPLILTMNQPEEAIYGGPIVNFIFGVGAAIFDFLSALSYKNPNYVAMALIAAGKDYGAALADRTFGSAEWGFNRNGYIQATVSTIVTNRWYQRGVVWGEGGERDTTMPNWGVFITESHGVMADSWDLNKGDDVYGNTLRPGVSKSSPYWKQVDRMYMVNSKARGVAKGFVNFFRLAMRMALAMTFTMATPPGGLSEGDFMQTAVVSKNYTTPQSGRVQISQDRGSTQSYDTAPVCGSSSGSGCPGGDSLKPYGETLDDRGKYFMGCGREMSLGCPSSTLSQDNPFGDYIDRN